jgi:UDP-glucose 4-epimerase
MKILVTGGAGYIGSNMTRMLIARGYEAVVLDTLEYGHKEAVPGEATLVVGNVSDQALLSKLFTEHHIDGVMHFAGYLQVEESVKFPIKYMKNNVIGPVALLQAMREFSVNHIIFSSTAAVYGTPLTVPITEDHRKEPVSPYGLSKWAFEELLRVYDRSYGIKSIALRYFNAAGASLDGRHGEVHNPETHLIPLACLTALGRRSDFSIYGTDYETPDGSALRDYIHIEDLCDAHIKVLEALINGHETQVYNVGTGVGKSVTEVVSEVKKAIDHDFPVTMAGRRPGDPSILVADPTRIMKEFGWQPKYSDLSTIIKSALAWHTAHPQGYAR